MVSIPKNARTVPLAVLIRVCWILWQKQAIPNSQCRYTSEIHFMIDQSPPQSRQSSPGQQSTTQVCLMLKPGPERDCFHFQGDSPLSKN